MKIKKLMDFLAGEANDDGRAPDLIDDRTAELTSRDEKVIYIDNLKLGAVSEQADRRQLISGGIQWSDQNIGDILIDRGVLTPEDVERIVTYQQNKDLYFGEAAVGLKLVSQDDILQALSSQFGYTYGSDQGKLSPDLIMAHAPFGKQAEEFRSIRSHLLSNWLSPETKTLAVVSSAGQDGRSHVAANLALAFSQSGRSTLLIDADMRGPRQHDLFNFTRRIGFSMLLAGRISMADLDALPDQISTFQDLSVLGCGAVPPNPAELLSKTVFPRIVQELKKYFDVIIFDMPPANFRSDVMSICAVAGSALLVTRAGHSRIADVKALAALLEEVDSSVVGSVLNQY